FLVRGPERLPDADRVIYNLGDGGVPVAAFAVVKDSVSADHKIVGVPIGECSDDVHLFAGGFTDAVAISEISAGESGHRCVAAGILDGEAEFATALVEKEGARLEDRFVFP